MRHAPLALVERVVPARLDIWILVDMGASGKREPLSEVAYSQVDKRREAAYTCDPIGE